MAPSGRLSHRGQWILVAWVCAAVTVVGLFQPWVSIGPMPKKTDAKTARSASRRTGIPKTAFERDLWNASRDFGKAVNRAAKARLTFTGVQIPRAANQRTLQSVLRAAAKTGKGNRQLQDIGWKSYMIYVLPALAIGLAAALTRWPSRPAMAAVMVAAAAVAIIGAGQLLLMSPDLAAKGARFETGLWNSLAAYAGLAVAAFSLQRTDRAS